MEWSSNGEWLAIGGHFQLIPGGKRKLIVYSYRGERLVYETLPEKGLGVSIIFF